MFLRATFLFGFVMFYCSNKKLMNHNSQFNVCRVNKSCKFSEEPRSCVSRRLFPWRPEWYGFFGYFGCPITSRYRCGIRIRKKHYSIVRIFYKRREFNSVARKMSNVQIMKFLSSCLFEIQCELCLPRCSGEQTIWIRALNVAVFHIQQSVLK